MFNVKGNKLGTKIELFAESQGLFVEKIIEKT